MTAFGAVGGRAADLTHRAQIAGADVAGQARIRQLEPEPLQLVEQGASPQMRALDQPRRHVVHERVERIRRRPRSHSGLPPPFRYLRTVLRSKPVWRAIAEID